RQYLKGEHETERRTSLSEFAKNKFGPGKGKIQKLVHNVARNLKHSTARLKFQHKDAERQLQSQPPQNCFLLDVLAARREQQRQAKQHRHAQHAHESTHSRSFTGLYFCSRPAERRKSIFKEGRA